MPIVEVEDQYLEQLRAAGIPISDRTADHKRAADHEAFIRGLSNDPKLRPKLLELISATGTYVPEIEAAKPIQSEVASLSKKFDDYIAAQEKAREEESKTREKNSTEEMIGKGRDFLHQQGWDDKGVEEVEKFMTENSVGSYKVASDYMKRQQPSPDPLPNAPWNGGRDLGASWFKPPDDAPDHKLLLENPRAFTQREIGKFMREKAEGRLQF